MFDALCMFLSRVVLFNLTREDFSQRLGVPLEIISQIEEQMGPVDNKILLNARIMFYEQEGIWVDNLYEQAMKKIEHMFRQYIDRVSDYGWLEIAFYHNMIMLDLDDNEIKTIGYNDEYIELISSNKLYCYLGDPECSHSTISTLLPIFRKYYGDENMSDYEFYINVKNSPFVNIIAYHEFKKAHEGIDESFLAEQLCVFLENRYKRNC